MTLRVREVKRRLTRRHGVDEAEMNQLLDKRELVDLLASLDEVQEAKEARKQRWWWGLYGVLGVIVLWGGWVTREVWAAALQELRARGWMLRWWAEERIHLLQQAQKHKCVSAIIGIMLSALIDAFSLLSTLMVACSWVGLSWCAYSHRIPPLRQSPSHKSVSQAFRSLATINATHTYPSPDRSWSRRREWRGWRLRHRRWAHAGPLGREVASEKGRCMVQRQAAPSGTCPVISIAAAPLFSRVCLPRSTTQGRPAWGLRGCSVLWARAPRPLLDRTPLLPHGPIRPLSRTTNPLSYIPPHTTYPPPVKVRKKFSRGAGEGSVGEA